MAPPTSKKFKKCHPHSHPRSWRVCCVPVCGSRDDGTATFHQFPKPGVKVAIENTVSGEVFYWDRRKIWEDRVGDDMKITKRTMVCSRHFADEDYNTTSRWKTSYRRLKPTAVPSLLLANEYSDFCQFHPPRTRQDFLDCLNNNNNNNIVAKSARVREKHPRSNDEENCSAPDYVGPSNETPLIHDDNSSRRNEVLLRDNDSTTSSNDNLLNDQRQSDDDIPLNVFSPLNSNEGVEEQLCGSDDELVLEDSKVDIKDEETRVKEDLMVEDRSESPEAMQKTVSKRKNWQHRAS